MCNKRILIHFECKCNNFFCIKHRYPEVHNCNFNYIEHNKEKLKINNPLIIGSKINKI